MKKPQHKLRKVKVQKLADAAHPKLEGAKSPKLSFLKKYSFSFKVTLGCVLFCIFGALLIFVDVKYMPDLEERDRTWLHSKARVVFAYVERKSGGRHEPDYYAHQLGYAYIVDGVAYYNDTMYYGSDDYAPSWESQSAAEQSLPKMGEEVSIRVNPNNSAQSAVGILEDDAFLIWLGVMFLLIGVVGCLSVEKK